VGSEKVFGLEQHHLQEAVFKLLRDRTGLAGAYGPAVDFGYGAISMKTLSASNSWATVRLASRTSKPSSPASSMTAARVIPARQ
jgi:hypothetical protein